MNDVIPVGQFATRHIAIFQNGIAFFHKSGEVDASTGQVKLDKLPIGTAVLKEQTQTYNRMSDANSVLFGSVSIYSTANPLLRTSAYQIEEESQVANTTLSELLSNNPDQDIRLTLKNSPSTYSGKIVSLTDDILLIKMEQGWKQIAMEAIDQLDFASDPDLFRKKMVRRTIHQLDFAESQRSTPLELMYFQKGITWLPNYHLQLLGNNQARLSLKANLLNDAEDLHDVAVNLVLGNPSFSDVEEPLFSSQSLSEFMSDFGSRSRTRSYYNTDDTVVHQRAAYNRPIRQKSSENDTPATGNLNDEDQFFFQVEHLNLPKGGRMLIHLLETDISYEDVYSARLQKDQRQRTRFDPEGKKSGNAVWHSLKFKNASGFPLPTGAIAFVKDVNGLKSPISQNKLDFVPAGLVAGVKMTKVPDVVVFDYEKIIDVEEKDQQKWKLLTIEATIEAGNFKNRVISLEIERELSGEPLSSDFPWTTGQLDEEEDPHTQSREVSWGLTLQPGEQKQITYRYKLYQG